MPPNHDQPPGFWKRFTRALRERIFGPEPAPKPPSIRPSTVQARSVQPPAESRLSPPGPEKPAPAPTPVSITQPPTAPALSPRDPYFLQIGFDFGTAYSKCVIRDVGLDKARVFLPAQPLVTHLPFLLPSRLTLNDGSVTLPQGGGLHYAAGDLGMLKVALHRVAEGNTNDPVLARYRSLLADLNLHPTDLPALVEACAASYFTLLLSAFKRDIASSYPDFGALPADYIAVNAALPVAAVEQIPVTRAFQRALTAAWNLTESRTDWQSLDVLDMLRRVREAEQSPSDDGRCYFYPEVSANVQGFVRSRTSAPDIYLFLDTGAGTVDASVFIYSRQEREKVTYLGAGVYRLGSSYIESRAAEHLKQDTPESLERLRADKEAGTKHPALEMVKAAIRKELSTELYGLLGTVKKDKLQVRRQLFDIKVIFGGGGHAENPYERATFDTFQSGIFPTNFDPPPAVGLPFPADLELKTETQTALWLKRLTVAYGLSFPKYELAPFRLPKDVPQPTEIWQPQRETLEFISKEMT